MATPKQVESICLLVSLKMLQLQIKRYVNIAKPKHAHKRELGVLGGVLDRIVSDMQGGSKASKDDRDAIIDCTGLSVAAATTYMRFCAVVGDTQNELLGTVSAEIDSTLNECLTPEILQLLNLQ